MARWRWLGLARRKAELLLARWVVHRHCAARLRCTPSRLCAAWLLSASSLLSGAVWIRLLSARPPHCVVYHLRAGFLGQYPKPTSKLMLTILEGVATWEREIMLERQREGLPRPSWQAVEPASDLH